jgi:hypothetical protein
MHLAKLVGTSVVKKSIERQTQLAQTCDRRIFVAMISLSLLNLSGCDTGPYTVPVRGRVTFDGKDWPAAGTLYFLPIEAATGFPKRPGLAPFDTTGKFAAQTFISGDGLFPGHYRLHVACWQVPPSMANPAGKSYVPAKFRNPSSAGLEVIVKPGDKSVDIDFDVRLSQPT